MNKLIEKIKSISVDDRKMMINKSTWIQESSLAVKYNNYYYPYSQSFETPLLPLFLYELSDLSFLNYFPVVLVRDGANSLFNFFQLWPKPEAIKTTLLINRNLFMLIPLEWKENVSFYTFSPKMTDTIDKDCDQVFISLFSDQKHCSLDFAKQALTDLRKKINSENSLKIKCLFTNNIPFGEQLSPIHQSGHIYKIVSLVSDLFENFDISYETIDSVSFTSMENTLVVDLNEHGFCFADDFINHIFASKGASFFYGKLPKKIKDGYELPYSFYHGLTLTNKYPKCFEVASSTIYTEYVKFTGKHEVKRIVPSEYTDYSKIILCEEDLKDFLIHHIKNFQKKNRDDDYC
jgi:hypothetical protein